MMRHLSTWGMLAALMAMLALSHGVDVQAASFQCLRGEPVLCADTDTVDMPILKQAGITVGTTAPLIVSVRVNQALGVSSVIQHSSLGNTRIEIIQISSTGGPVTSTASPRILDGVDGQLIILQGTSASNSYTIPDGTGVQFTTTASVTFDDRCSMVLRFNTTLDWWEELSRACGAVAGGGTGLELAPVRALVSAGTNVNIAAPGTILDGLTFSTGQSVALNGQTTPAQNGIYLYATSSTPMTRRTDLDVSGEWALGLHFTVQEGTEAGTRWELANLTAVTQGTTAVSFRRQAPAGLGELIANRSTVATSVANGTIGSDANGRVPYNRLGSDGVHTALAPANAINPTTTSSFEIGIASTGGLVDLTSNPQIVAGINGQLLILYGTSASNTVQIDDVTIQAAGGVRLCGGQGSVVVGLNNDDLILRYSTALTAWVQHGCQSLQSAKNTGRDIFGLTTTGTAVRLGGDLNNHLRIYTPPGGLTRIEGITGGSLNANHEVDLGVGGDFSVKNHLGATLFNVDNDTGTITGTVSTTGGVCQVIDSVTSADDNRPLDSSNRARTVTGVWCNYAGPAPTTVATFTLSDGSGNAMTITGTSPTCVGPATIPAIATVTANNTLTPREMLRWSTSNTPNPATDVYEICVGWLLTD